MIKKRNPIAKQFENLDYPNTFLHAFTYLIIATFFIEAGLHHIICFGYTCSYTPISLYFFKCVHPN